MLELDLHPCRTNWRRYEKAVNEARGTPQLAAEDDSDDELEVLPSNAQVYWGYVAASQYLENE